MAAERPPYTIDAQTLSRFDQRNTVFGRRRWDGGASFYGRNVHDNAARRIESGLEGYSRLEFARARAAWTVSDHFRGAYSWETLGRPSSLMSQLGPYKVADRAEMSEEVKRTARAYGAALVGIAALDRRWVYSHDTAGKPIEIPPPFQYAVVMAVRMDATAIAASPAFAAATATGVGYSRMAFCIACLAQFIRELGYRAIPMGNDTALSIPLAIDAGLGELGRNGLLITPEVGPCVRLCKVFTDLPLLPDRPRSYGIQETCTRCRRCAQACEVDAISSDPDPSFRVVSKSNNPGILRWAVNPDRCYTYWADNGASCSTCIAACPYTRLGCEASS